MSVLELKGEVHDMLAQVNDERHLKQIKFVISNLLDDVTSSDTDEYVRELLASFNESSTGGRSLSEDEILQIFSYLKRQTAAKMEQGKIPTDDIWFEMTPVQQDELLLAIAESYDDSKLVSQKETHKMFAQWSGK